jgi:hypothetical protein
MKLKLNEKTMTRGALLVGPVVRIDNIVTGEILGVPPADTDRFLAFSRRFRVRRHEGGRLGLTVVGSRMVKKCCSIAWLTPVAIGDDEANFLCTWDDEHLDRLKSLVKLQVRRPTPKPS